MCVLYFSEVFFKLRCNCAHDFFVQWFNMISHYNGFNVQRIDDAHCNKIYLSGLNKGMCRLGTRHVVETT